jgi:MYXO-CTERM domain-containing protein
VNFVPGANTVSVDIYGNLASVHFTDFANVRGGGFVDPGVSLQLTAVPEPGALGLALIGFAALFGARRRARA